MGVDVFLTHWVDLELTHVFPCRWTIGELMNRFSHISRLLSSRRQSQLEMLVCLAIMRVLEAMRLKTVPLVLITVLVIPPMLLNYDAVFVSDDLFISCVEAMNLWSP